MFRAQGSCGLRVSRKRQQVSFLVTLGFSFLCAKAAPASLAIFAAAGLGSLGTLPFFLLMLGAMYLLMVVPQQRKQKQWNAMLSSIKTGDKVTTNAGLRGTVVAVKDDTLVIRTSPDGVKLEFVKSAIAAVTTDDEPAKS